ncbi:MAG: hypothetical protein NDI61_02065 [Bdellovibrionaceae bacterium]|nr:hypothetical protein [Pseudobdellovibrionaceae bacterium]
MKVLSSKWTKVTLLSPVLLIGSLMFFYQNCSPTGFQPAHSVESTQASVEPHEHQNAESGLAIQMGLLRATSAGATAGLPIEGRMMFVRDSKTGSRVYVQAIGLSATGTYMSHVHDQPCSLGGGGHYKIDTSVTTAEAQNEIWPNLTMGMDGVALGFASVAHVARPEAQSVVLHATDNTRLACGTLYPQGSVTQKSGTFSTLPGGTNLGRTITGSGVLIRHAGGGQTVLKLAATGLAANTSYTAHVHNQACANMAGGAHYKQNLAVTEVTASAANEIWATLATNANGMAVARTVVIGHVARPDAMAVVIHNTDAQGTRLACLDLLTEGGFQSTAAGLERGRNVTGTARIDRLPSGQTRVAVKVAGLAANTTYMAHVHDRPCHISGGGGHYKIDPSVTTAVESNEIWPHVMTGADGAGSATVVVEHLARPEAQSIVIHDPADSGRLACVDID